VLFSPDGLSKGKHGNVSGAGGTTLLERSRMLHVEHKWGIQQGFFHKSLCFNN